MATLVVCASGFTTQEKAKISENVTELGGKFEADLTQAAQVLIAKHYGTLKTQTSSDKNIPIVTIKWLDDSYRKKKFNDHFMRYKLNLFAGLKIWPYRIPKEKTRAIQKKGGQIVENFSPDCFCVITANKNISYLQYCLPETKIIPEEWLDECLKMNKWIDPQTIVIAKSINDDDYVQEYYLGKCVFWVDGIDPEEERDLKELIIIGGGTYVNKFLPRVTHIITRDMKKHPLNVRKVSPEWLRDCSLQKICIPGPIAII
ncbi:unnamed protein product [Blepharisma stoltei]|uniref:BRCT domain-containing protein n=1 Tax=Blepharisma stoltei TaxID=1481888 RepID=A0AAU9K2Z4_9CILI|nr:unnamed protein product [Blepharisma stoltei]